MTFSIDGHDLGQLIEIAAWAGSILVLLAIGLIFYLLVRPVRKAKAEPEIQSLSEDMLQLMERMERRHDTHEQADRNDPADQDRPTNTERDRSDQRRIG